MKYTKICRLFIIFTLFAALLSGCEKDGVESITNIATTQPSIGEGGFSTGGMVTSTTGLKNAEYGVVISTSNQNPTINDIRIAADSENIYMSTAKGNYQTQFTLILNQLSQGTGYYIRAYVQISNGEAYGNTIYFTAN